MCTLTIIRQEPNKFLITMNRDDAKVRTELENPPEYRHINQVVGVAMPVDGLRGGTWVGASDRGEVLCLLNRYDPIPYQAETSRGDIIPYLLGREQSRPLGDALQDQIDNNRFSPFTLIFITQSVLKRFEWDGKTLHDFDEILPDENNPFVYSSSSWKTEDVLQWRYDQFDDWYQQGAEFEEKIPSFHLLQPDDRKEWSPFVEREKVHTSSITQIELMPNGLQMLYWTQKDLDPAEPTCMLNVFAEKIVNKGYQTYGTSDA